MVLYNDLGERLLEKLAADGFMPSNSPYSSSEIAGSLSAAFGATPEIVCSATSEGERLLSEVRVCVSQGMEVMACPPSSSTSTASSCGSSIVFTPVTSKTLLPLLYFMAALLFVFATIISFQRGVRSPILEADDEVTVVLTTTTTPAPGC